MSVRVMTWVWANSAADPVDRFVLLAIADCANDEGADAYPSTTTLATKTGLHERSVQRSIARLVANGELIVHKNAGPKGANRYRVTMTPGTPPGGVTPPRQSATPAESRSTPGRVPPHPRHTATSTPGTPPPEPSLNHPRTVKEPSLAQAIVGEWIEHCSKRPPKVVIGQVARQVGALLTEGIDPDDVRRGLAQWMTRDLHPSTLPSIVNSVMNTRASPRGKPSTTDQRVSDALRLAERFERGEITA